MSINDLPDGVIGSIMSFADFGGSSGWHVRRPAARFGRVCKRWRDIYAFTARGDIFVANDKLSRLLDWSIETNNRQGRGMEKSIVNRHGWWTSDYVFDGGRWVEPYGDPVVELRNSEGGPFRVRRGLVRGVRTSLLTPQLRVTFEGPVQLRAVLFSARNRPRKILLKNEGRAGSGGNPNDQCEMEVPPPVGDGNPFYYDGEISGYDLLVERMLPQGNAATENDHLEMNLPVVIPGENPFIIEDDEILSITIMESHERGWVGINSLMLYGAVLPER